MSKTSTIGKSLKNTGLSDTNVSSDGVTEVVTLTIAQGGFTLDDVNIISGTIDGVVIGSDNSAPANFTSITSGSAAGVGYISIFYGKTIGEFMAWDPTLGRFTVSGDISVSQTTELGNISISGNTISTKNSNGDIIIDPNDSGGLVITGDITQNTTTGDVSFRSSNGGFSAIFTDNIDFSSSNEFNIVSSQQQTFNSTNGDIILQSGSSKSIGIITFISSGNTPTLTSSNHNLEVGDEISITNTNSTPNINGIYTVTIVLDINNFKISPGFSVVSTGNSGTFTKNTDIYLSASNNINIPYDVNLTFGADTNYIMSTSSPLNEMNIVSNDDINILPRNNINILDNKGLTFGGDTQMIKSVSGVLSVTANESIILQSNTSITGTLSVSGISTLNETNIQDPILTIGTQTIDSKDRGIEYIYGTSSIGFFGRDSTDDYFMYIPEATNTGDVISGSLGNAKFNIGSFNSISIDSEGSISSPIVNACSISCSNTLEISGSAGINLNTPSGGRVSLIQGSILALGSNTIVNTGSDTILTSSGNTYLTTGGDVIIQESHSLVFNGLSGSQKISGTTTQLTLNSSSYLNLTQISGGVRLTQDLPLIFNTDETTKIIGTSSGNLDVISSNYINLNPGGHVYLPVNKRLELGSIDDYIGSIGLGNVVLVGSTYNSTTSGDTQFTSSSGNILMSPSSYVKISKNKSLFFGDSTEFIKSDTLNNISINSLSNQNYNAVNISLNVSGYIIIPSGRQLRFGSSNENISGTSGILSLTSTSTVISGNLIVNGSTTTVNSTNVTIKDPIITIGEEISDSKDRGVEYRYSSNKLGFFGYDDSQDVFTFIPDAVNTNELIAGDAGNVKFGYGTFTTIESPEIISDDITSSTSLNISSSDDITLVPGSGDIIIPENTNLNIGNSSLSSDGVGVTLSIPTPGKFNLGTTYITGDLSVTGTVFFPGLLPTFERFTISINASRNPENGVSNTFVTVTSTGSSGISTGTMPSGPVDGYVKNIIMTSIADGCSYELTFNDGLLVDAVSGTSNAKKMIFDRSGQSVSMIWDSSASSWFILNAGGELVLL